MATVETRSKPTASGSSSSAARRSMSTSRVARARSASLRSSAKPPFSSSRAVTRVPWSPSRPTLYPAVVEFSLELDDVARLERRIEYAHSGNSVNAIAAELAAIIHYEQQQVAVSGHS